MYIDTSEIAKDSTKVPDDVVLAGFRERAVYKKTYMLLYFSWAPAGLRGS